MKDLIIQLGINWKLLLSQALNFFILLFILRAFVYKPVLEVIKKREDKIRQGLEKAKEADVRLKEVDNISKEKIKEAEQESIDILKNTENKAKLMSLEMQKKAEEKQKEIKELLRQSYESQKEEAKNLVYKEASELIKKAFIKAVQLDPKAVDEALIKKAVLELKNEKQ